MCDCEPPSASVSMLRKARTEHTCCECGATIYVAEIYEYISGVWDGRGSSFHTCMVCAELRKEIERELEAYDCAPCFTQLYSDLEQDML